MAFIPLPLGIKVSFEMAKNNQLVVNVFHVTTTLPITTINLTALANVFIDWWSDSGEAVSSSALALTRIVATDVSVENGLQVVTDLVPNIPGGVVGTTTPSQVALALSWRTGFSGRSFRGRTFFAGLIDSDVSSNLVSSIRMTAITGAYATLRSELTTAGFVLCVASYQANGVPRTTGLATPVSALVADNRVDTQRRRLPGAGV